MRSFIADQPAEWTVKPTLPGPPLMREEYETELEWKRRKAAAVASATEATKATAKHCEPKPEPDLHDFGCY